MLWEEALFLWPDLKELQKLKKLEEVIACLSLGWGVKANSLCYWSLFLMALSALTSNAAQRSNNFYNFLTSKGILNPKL